MTYARVLIGLDSAIEKTPVMLTSIGELGVTYSHFYSNPTNIIPLSNNVLSSAVPWLCLLEGVLTSSVALKDIYKNYKRGYPFHYGDLFAFFSGIPLMISSSYTLYHAATLTVPASIGMIAIAYAIKSGTDFIHALVILSRAEKNSEKEKSAEYDILYHFAKMIGWTVLVVAIFTSGPGSVISFAIGGVTLGAAAIIASLYRVPTQGLLTKRLLSNAVKKESYRSEHLKLNPIEKFHTEKNLPTNWTNNRVMR